MKLLCISYFSKVSLGVLLNNEAKLNEMKHILAHYIKRVPTIEAERNYVCANGYEVPVDDTRFDSKLIGGDQLTVSRIWGAQLMRSSQDKRIDHYEG